MRSSATQDNNSTSIVDRLCDWFGLFTDQSKVINSQALAKSFVYYSIPYKSDLSRFFANRYNANTELNNKIISSEKRNPVALSPDPAFGLKSKQFGTRWLCGQRGNRGGDQQIVFALDLARDEIVEYAKDSNYLLHRHILWAESATDVWQGIDNPNQIITRVINPAYPWKEKGLDPNKLSKEGYRDINSLNENSNTLKL